MLMMGQSVASFPGVAIPPPAKGVSRMELRQFKLVLWPLERD